ncbi:AzlD domain-containing protein [Amphibiibacter pelophylacis]|uniref:AzlD domain-containing protein n=1 Tax=Amphibiibacter pelophylacis TaxID=1799477 RepID=UPI003BFA7873
MNDFLGTGAVILGLAVITVLTRGFFILPRREIPLPAWLRAGLRYAPLGALAAIIVPGVVMNGDQLTPTLLDAQIAGALAGIAWFAWRQSVLGTIVAGMAVMLLLRLGLGWA